MNGTDATGKNIESRSLHLCATSVQRAYPDRRPPRGRQKELQVCAIQRQEHAVPGFVERKNLLGAHAKKLFLVTGRWRGTRKGEAADSV